VILTGLPGSGKSTLCQMVIDNARERNIGIKGVLSPPFFESGEKIGIDLVDLSTGQRARLAKQHLSQVDTTRITTQKWAFDPNMMEKGSQILQNSTPCDLLVIDELGPLEFERGEGWIAGLQALDSGAYQSALVVIRPRLLDSAMLRWPDAVQIEIHSPEQVPALARQAIQMLGLPA